ncbi:hypothetical protein P171DRAFT_373401, partial [Karstenula rhodostoma CBS 690.94]
IALHEFVIQFHEYLNANEDELVRCEDENCADEEGLKDTLEEDAHRKTQPRRENEDAGEVLLF